MNPLWLTVALAMSALGQEGGQLSRMPPSNAVFDDFSPRRNINGEWMVVRAELNGKPIEIKSITQVTIKNKHVTCRHGSTEMSWRLEFGPYNTVRCAERINGVMATTGMLIPKGDGIEQLPTLRGVYSVSKEFFFLALAQGENSRAIAALSRPANISQDTWKNEAPLPFGDQRQIGTPHLVIILRRLDAPSVQK